jgi:hypothetical protein
MNKEALENIKKTVVFLGHVNPKQVSDEEKSYQISLCGTGFLLQIKRLFFLATAKHVIAKLDKEGDIVKEIQGLHIFNNLKNGTVRYSSVDAIKKKYKIFYHPNKKVDLVLIPFPLNPENDDARVLSEDMFVNFEEVVETSDVFFVSYQPGISNLVTDTKVHPIIRKGSIARVNKNKTIYIDGSVFPGNSGSPVFILPSPIRYTSKGVNIGNDNIGGKFLGIISQYMPYSEVAISQQTGRPRIIFEENTGLSLLFSNEFVLEISETDDCKEFIDKNTPAKKNI